MMYQEFIQLAGYEVTVEDYDNIIEPMYMATNLTKIDFISTIDRKRFEVKHQKTADQIRLEKEIKVEIADLKDQINSYEDRIKHLQYLLGFETDPYWIKSWKDEVKRFRQEIKNMKIRINGLKWVLA